MSYVPILTRLKDDRDFVALSPAAKLVFYTLRLATGPCGIECMPALRAQLAESTGLAEGEIAGALAELTAEAHPWIAYQGAIVWVRHGLRHNPSLSLSNPKHVAAIEKHLQSLPKAEIINAFATAYELPRPHESMGDEWLPDSLSGSLSDSLSDTVVVCSSSRSKRITEAHPSLTSFVQDAGVPPEKFSTSEGGEAPETAVGLPVRHDNHEASMDAPDAKRAVTQPRQAGGRAPSAENRTEQVPDASGSDVLSAGAPNRPETPLEMVMGTLRQWGYRCDRHDGSIAVAMLRRYQPEEIENMACGLALLCREAQEQPSMAMLWSRRANSGTNAAGQPNAPLQTRALIRWNDYLKRQPNGTPPSGIGKAIAAAVPDRTPARKRKKP